MTLSTFKKNNQGRREDIARKLGYDNADTLLIILSYPRVLVQVK